MNYLCNTCLQCMQFWTWIFPDLKTAQSRAHFEAPSGVASASSAVPSAPAESLAKYFEVSTSNMGRHCKAAIFRLEQKPFRGYLHSHQSLHCLQWRRFLGWTGKHGRHIHGAVMQKFVMNCEGDGDVSKKRTSDKHTEIVPPPRI